jgi:proteasome accessory factor A
MLTACRTLAASPHLPDVALYKNNVDGKGASYGTHENYLMDRSVPFGDVIRYLTPFLVTRQVVCGSGRVGIGASGERGGFQISQRADYVEAEVGLETTLRRPIINTRDEPHADPARYRRLHLIVGDANLLEVSTYLKLGTTALLLWLLERGSVPLELDGLELVDPVGELHAVSRDVTLSHRLTLADGRSMTALDVQRLYLEVLARAVEATGASEPQTEDVLARWGSVLGRLEADPMTCARDVEWVAKLRLLEAMRARDHLSWDNARLAAMDLQWSDVRPERGVFARLVAAGAVDRLVSQDEVATAVHEAPADTRAYFRGESVRRYGRDVAAVNWDSVVFDLPGEKSLQRVPMLEPHRGTRDHVGALLDRSPDAAALVGALVTRR